MIFTEQTINSNHDQGLYSLSILDVKNALSRANSSDVSKLIGLLSHFTYW